MPTASIASTNQTMASNHDHDNQISLEVPDKREYSTPTAMSTSERSHDEDLESNEKPQEVQQPQQQTAKDPNLIEFDGPDDPTNPQNWSPRYKWTVTTILSSVTFCVTFASSVFSTATRAAAKEYDVSEEVMILGTSLFVLGFAVGPLIWGPLSEAMGRKVPMFAGFAIFAIFQIPVAVAQNVYTIMICRFIGGVFGCAPLAIIGGMMADMVSTDMQFRFDQ